MALGNIRELLPATANFQYSVKNNLHTQSSMNGILVETNGLPVITFSVYDDTAIRLFEKMEEEFPHCFRRTRHMSGSGTQHYLSADYIVGSYVSFMAAYNKHFLWKKFSKDFDKVVEAELEKKTE